MAFGKAEASNILESRPQDVAAIAAQLKQMMAIGDKAFLIVYAGDYYVQFYVIPGGKRLAVEAISNAYLPAKKRIGEDTAAGLAALGFAQPLSDANFTMDYELTGEADFTVLAVMALAALYEVYRCPQDERLSFELNQA